MTKTSSTVSDGPSGAAPGPVSSGGVSFKKNPASGSGATAPPPRRGLFGGANAPVRVTPVAVPRSINIAVAGIVLSVLGQILEAIGLNTSNTWVISQLHQSYKDYVKSNTSDHKKSESLQAYVTSGLHSTHMVWVQLVLVSVVLLILGWSLRRTRAASASRWALLVVYVLTRMPLSAVPAGSLPAVLSAALLMSGIGSIVTIVWVFFIRSSRDYFRNCRAAVNPASAGAATGSRPSLFGSLFNPKRPAAKPGATATTATPTRPATTRPASSGGASVPRAKAKVRTDSDAVAKGAELARTRAKASKSRRSE